MANAEFALALVFHCPVVDAFAFVFDSLAFAIAFAFDSNAFDWNQMHFMVQFNNYQGITTQACNSQLVPGIFDKKKFYILGGTCCKC